MTPPTPSPRTERKSMTREQLLIAMEEARPYVDFGSPRQYVKEVWKRLNIEAEAAPAGVPRVDPDRLTAIIESRMSQQLAWLGDDGKTVSMLGPEQAGWHLAHLYMTGDVVSGLPALAASPSAAPLDVGRLVLHSDDDDCQPPHVHRHHWVDVLYPADKVWFYCTGCEERRIKPNAAHSEEGVG